MLVNIYFWEQPLTSFVEVINVFLAVLDDNALIGVVHLLAREIIGRTVSALRGLDPLNTSGIGFLKQLYLFEDSGTYDPTPSRV